MARDKQQNTFWPIKENEYPFRSNSVKIIFAVHLKQDLLLKEVYSKRKEFAPFRSKFFPFSVEPLIVGHWCTEKQNTIKQRVVSNVNIAETKRGPVA